MKENNHDLQQLQQEIESKILQSQHEITEKIYFASLVEIGLLILITGAIISVICYK